MTIRFPDAAAIRADHGDTLDAWGSPAVLSSEDASARLQEVRTWAVQSSTARGILAEVEASVNVVSIICLEGGRTVFESGSPNSRQACAFWNVRARYAIGNGPNGQGQQTFHPYVALLHELGHAVQWIMNPGFFEGRFPYSTDAEQTIRDEARQRVIRAERERRRRDGQPAMNYRGGREFANAVLGPDTPSATPQGWSPRIEIDNLNRHEWPICREVGLPLRLNYLSLVELGT